MQYKVVILNRSVQPRCHSGRKLWRIIALTAMASSAWCGTVERSRAFVRGSALITTRPGCEPKSASARAGRTVFGRPVWASSLTPAKDGQLSTAHRIDCARDSGASAAAVSLSSPPASYLATQILIRLRPMPSQELLDDLPLALDRMRAVLIILDCVTIPRI